MPQIELSLAQWLADTKTNVSFVNWAAGEIHGQIWDKIPIFEYKKIVLKCSCEITDMFPDLNVLTFVVHGYVL